MLGIGDEDEVDVPQSIPLNGEGFDLSLDLAGLEETVLLLTNLQTVATDCIPCLGQGEASVL